jgi:hypothetical protein
MRDSKAAWRSLAVAFAVLVLGGASVSLAAGGTTGAGGVLPASVNVTPTPGEGNGGNPPGAACLTLPSNAGGGGGGPAISAGVRVAGPQPTPVCYSVLEFVITTGSDDQRSDSSSFATVVFPTGAPKTCALKAQNADSWDNWTTHTVPCAIFPATFDYLRKSAVTITLVGHYSGPFNSADNWNVERVLIQAFQPGSGLPALCVVNVSGDPLVRLTQSAPSVVVTYFPSRC